MHSVFRASRFFIWAGLILCSVWILWPGLYGNFYLDDFPNLSPLENAGKNGTPLFSYLLNPAVSGLGRPLSYLTFLAQKEAWPNDPFAFKLVNLVIHFCNALLVYFLARFSLRLYFKSKTLPISSLAIACALVWLILPIHSSAIFYVVQRMTLLSAMFSLLGIVGYLWVRKKYSSWSAREYCLATAFVCVGYLGVLAKENAILTGLLILAMELTFLANRSWRPNMLFQLTVLLLPFLFLLIYLFGVNDVISGYDHRDFNLKERLLTQAVIFWEYVSKVFVPTPSRLHLFNDGGKIYGQVFLDFRVFASLLGFVVALGASLFFRKKYPWFSFGVLFFVFGHLLESTFIPLEMNFEHRNYLPSVGLVLGGLVPLALYAGFFSEASKRRRFVYLSMWLWVAFIASVSVLEARTWGSSKSFALSSLVDRPESYRARQEAAAFFLGNGEYLTAANLLYSIDVDFKVYAGTYAQLLLLKCYDKSIPIPSDEEIVNIFENAPVDMGAEVALHDLWRIKRKNNDACGHIGWNELLVYLDALNSNENFSGSLNLALLSSFISADNGDYNEAIRKLKNLAPDQKTTAVQILIARFHIMGGQWSQALELIERITESAGELDMLVYGKYLKTLKEGILGKNSAQD